MKKNLLFQIGLSLPIILLIGLIGCKNDNAQYSYPSSISLTIENNIEMNRNDELILISLSEINKYADDFNENYFVILLTGDEIPCQLVDIDGDNIPDAIASVIDLSANSKKNLLLKYNPVGEYKKNYPIRTQSNLSVKTDYKLENGYYKDGYFKSVEKIKLPEGHFPHNAFIKTEGPSWESEKIAYRFYLDERNRNDIFVKKVDSMITHIVGINDLVSDSKESYTQMTEWGMDNFKVGQTLGIGSIAILYNNEVITVSNTDSVVCIVNNNGPILSGVSTDYFGWQVNSTKYDLNSNLTISAGSRLTKTSLTITGEPDNICTGLAKHDNTSFIKSEDNEESEWGYIALYGKQSLAGDNMGIVLFYKKNDLIKRIEDDRSYIVTLKPNDGVVEYYFGAAWENELNGIKTESEFVNYIKHEQIKLSNPVKISLNN